MKITKLFAVLTAATFSISAAAQAASGDARLHCKRGIPATIGNGLK